MEKYTIQKKSLRYIENFDEDFSFSDYTPHELYEMNKDSQSTKNFKEKYFYYCLASTSEGLLSLLLCRLP